MKLIYSLMVMIFATNSLAATEGQWTHGGDPIIGSVHEAIAQVYLDIENLPAFLLPTENFAESFQQTYQKTEIIVKESLKWNGQDVTAINYPWAFPPKMEVSSQRWSLIADDPIAQRKIILHEFLFLMKLDDTRYIESTRLSSLIDSYSYGDIKSIIIDAHRLNRLYSQSSRWSAYLLTRKMQFKNGAETLNWLANEGYVASDDWLNLFFSVLRITPLRVCNTEAAQAYLTLMLQGDSVAHAAIARMAQLGFSPNPSLNSQLNLCAH